MVAAKIFLKPRLARQLLQRALTLLPVGASLAIWQGERCLSSAEAEDAPALTPDTLEVESAPLTLEGETVGLVLWRAPADCREVVRIMARLLIAFGEDLLRSEQARHAVTAETLEVYRELALIQRATEQITSSLKPEEVAAAILNEFEAHIDAADWGAVYRFDTTSEIMVPVHFFGPEAESLFAEVAGQPLFRALATRQLSGIFNDLQHQEAWTGGDRLPCRSLLSLPLLAQQSKVGLLLLAGRQPEGFLARDMKQVQALAALAAAALKNAQLFTSEQAMFRSFIAVIATAIDAKSPYTAGHCRRVPIIAEMLAREADRDSSAPFENFRMEADDWYALEVATSLHDCGKMVTPEWVVDKKTKLETIFDRIHLVKLRIGLMKCEAELEHYRTPPIEDRDDTQGMLRERLAELDDYLSFLVECNLGNEFLAPAKMERLRHIATLIWHDETGNAYPLLDAEELDNLLIQRGTLNVAERGIIEEHAVHTIRMLKEIPFSPALANVVEYAGGHHERLDGSGYPNNLVAEQLSIPARIVAIADIFEALTAPDRPYRKPNSLSQAIEILHRMVQARHVDGDLFRLFLRTGVHNRYAQQFLAQSQVDAVDEARYLNDPGTP